MPSNDDPPMTREYLREIIAIADEHNEVLRRLKRAILDGDSAAEHALAREACGLPKEPTQ